MNMDMSSGLPWLDHPITLHSSRKDTCKLTPAQCAYRSGYWRYWYQADHVYALGTIYFVCAAIGIFAIGHIIDRLLSTSLSKRPVWRKTVALLRYGSYKAFRIASLSWWSPSLGIILLGLIGVVFFSVMTLGPKPYYWPNTKKLSYGNSPPIATRTGWMAVALLPFSLAIASKVNLVTIITGVSHEKLQVFHRWISWAMFVLALIHTFPFVVFHIWKGDMTAQYKISVVYWTGVAALIPQTWLTFMSIGPIRNRFYELFKVTHYLASLLFILFFFFHCDFRLTSWDYFIATGALYIPCLLYSAFRTYFVGGCANLATLTMLPNGTLRVDIDTKMKWGPGQHFFVRFLTLHLHALTSHPFSACSLPSSDTKGRPEPLVLYIQPNSGLTARLACLAQKQLSKPIRVFLDGPYGGLNVSKLSSYDKILIIAGGSGAGSTLSVIEDLLRRKSSSSPTHFQSIRVILATRDSEIPSWYTGSVQQLLSSHLKSSGSDKAAGKQEILDSTEKIASPDTVESDSIGEVSVYSTGRPDLSALIRSLTTEDSRSVGISACGPESMTFDVRNAAAAAESRILEGKEGSRDVYLHTEVFS
ncbi:ferric-chelate reductase [Glonium stellatum]|uniref:Ferric-chelate reductase n=1 Tax=Glonium stellatum TaxID=574774 RepID=A0A8E2FCK9_9PEZI|nr:ferric-chelate reductase [Glonium stellatum]